MATAQQERKGQIRQAEVLELARGGESNYRIAERLGCSESLVRYHVKAWVAAKEPPAERAQELREVWYDRLETAHSKVWPLVLEGDAKAVETMLKIQAQAARLFGLELQPSLQVQVVTAEAMVELFRLDSAQQAIEGTATEETPDDSA